MPKSDSQEVFVAVCFEAHNPESSDIVYAGHDEKLAMKTIKAQEPGEYDYAQIQRWKDGERKHTKEFNISQRAEVTEL